jgi:hypothetical protein
MIWMVALMYRAYSVSCNLTRARGILSFTGALIIAHALSLVIIFSLHYGSPFSMDSTQGNETEMVIPQGQTVNQTAEIVIDAFKKSDFKKVRSYFDDRMKDGLSELQLRISWMQVTQQYGKLTGADVANATVQQGDDYSLLLIPLTFEKGSLNLQLAFRSEGRVSGMYFK